MNGNLTQRMLSSSTALRYCYGGWNRLVKIEHVTNPGGSETVITRGEYQYNGLNWRTVKKGDTDADGVLDQQRVMHYSAGWQLIEEDVDDDIGQADGDGRRPAQCTHPLSSLRRAR
jgi:hypothetical protein